MLTGLDFPQVFKIRIGIHVLFSTSFIKPSEQRMLVTFVIPGENNF